MKISEIFEINQGIQITDDEIYNSIGDIPILTANNEIKGHGSSSIVSENDLPCLSYPSKAFTGHIFVQDKLFNANNTAILIPRTKYRNEINLKYFAIILGELFLSNLSSESQVSYLGKEILSHIDIAYPFPPISEQNAFVEQYEKLEEMKAKVNYQIDKIDKMKKLTLVGKSSVISNPVPMKDIFNIYGGNQGLYEDIIYNNQPINAENAVKIISSALDDNNQMRTIDINAKIGKKPLKYFNEDIVVITRKGNPGKTRFFPKEKIAITETAYVLTLKPKYVNLVNLKWFNLIAYQYTEKANSSDDNNGTFSKDVFENILIESIPPISEQNAFVEQYEKLEEMRRKLERVIELCDMNNKEYLSHIRNGAELDSHFNLMSSDFLSALKNLTPTQFADAIKNQITTESNVAISAAHYQNIVNWVTEIQSLLMPVAATISAIILADPRLGESFKILQSDIKLLPTKLKESPEDEQPIYDCHKSADRARTELARAISRQNNA